MRITTKDRALLDRLTWAQLARVHRWAAQRQEHGAHPPQPMPMRHAMRAVEDETRRRGRPLCTVCSAPDPLHRNGCTQQ